MWIWKSMWKCEKNEGVGVEMEWNKGVDVKECEGVNMGME